MQWSEASVWILVSDIESHNDGKCEDAPLNCTIEDGYIFYAQNLIVVFVDVHEIRLYVRWA